jgi:predicted RNA-binding protein YlqC (UPF0109 family)
MNKAEELALECETTSAAKSLVLGLAKALVDRCEAVVIETIRDGKTVTLRLEEAPEDLGKIIGKQGRTARSIRTILAASAMRTQMRFALDIQKSRP